MIESDNSLLHWAQLLFEIDLLTGVTQIFVMELRYKK